MHSGFDDILTEKENTDFRVNLGYQGLLISFPLDQQAVRMNPIFHFGLNSSQLTN